MKNGLRPIHPGEILREEYLAPLGITPHALSKALRVPPARINDICLGRRGITPDTALRLAPGPLGDIRVERSGAAVTATALAGATRVVVNLVRPTETGQIPFHAMVVAREGIAQRTLAVGEHYVVPGLEAFLAMARTGRPPLAYDDLLRPIRFLAAVARAVRG